jgi:hypothetical protein
MGKPTHIQHNLGMFKGTIMTPFTRKQPLNAYLASAGFIGPIGTISPYKTLAVVLMHAGINALLRVWRSGD